jgi:hypothetical protein
MRSSQIENEGSFIVELRAKLKSMVSLSECAIYDERLETVLFSSRTELSVYGFKHRSRCIISYGDKIEASISNTSIALEYFVNQCEWRKHSVDHYQEHHPPFDRFSNNS